GGSSCSRSTGSRAGCATPAEPGWSPPSGGSELREAVQRVVLVRCAVPGLDAEDDRPARLELEVAVGPGGERVAGRGGAGAARAVDVGGPGLDEVHVVAAKLERARRAGRVDVDLAELVVADQARVHVIAVGVEPDRARAGAAAQRPGRAGGAPGALRASVALRPLGAGRPGVALGPCGSGVAGLAARPRGAGVGRRGRSERAAPEVLGQQRVVLDLARRDRV